MKKRVISGIIGAVFLYLILYLSKYITFTGIIALSFIALLEYEKAVGVKINIFVLIQNLICSSSIVLLSVFKPEYILLFIFLYVLALFVYMILANEGFNFILKLMFGTFYVCVCFAHIALTRNIDKPDGYYFVWTIFICSFFTDIFAMLGGKLFGKHHIFPILSPKKTLEGSVTGLVFGIIGMVLYGLLLEKLGMKVSYLSLIIVGFITSIASMVGDLCASCIKRKYNIKDYGKIMPGHGGILDRFDSVLFAAPVFYYLIVIFPIIL